MTTQTIVALITMYANMFGVDPDLAVSVATVESRLKVDAVGSVGELGLFQIRPEFNKQYTKKQLRDPNINTLVGVRKLAELKKTCVHKTDINFLVCYNYGSEAAKRVKFPHKFPYVVKVKKEMAKVKQERLLNDRFVAAIPKPKSFFEEFLDKVSQF